jgi:choline transport protein
MESSKEVTIELQARNDSNENFNNETKSNSFDQADMRRMGREQQLRRNFHSFSILGLTCVAMGTWLNIILYGLWSESPWMS